MFERFTERSRAVVVNAGEEARRLGHDYVGTEHLLLGLLRGEGVAAKALSRLGVDYEEARGRVETYVGYGEAGGAKPSPAFTPRSKKILELAYRESLDLDHEHIGTEHILLGMCRESEGVAARVFFDFEAEPDKIRREVMRIVRSPSSEEDVRTRPSGSGEMVFRGSVANLRIGALVWKLEYEYSAEDTAGSVLDHEKLTSEVARILERKDAPPTVEDAVSMVGVRVLGEFPVVRMVSVSASRRFGSEVGIEVSRTFRR